MSSEKRAVEKLKPYKRLIYGIAPGRLRLANFGNG
jgi:hypothetical protein